MKGTISFLAGALVGLMTLVVSPQANAHSADEFYDWWWHDSEKPVRWHFDNDFPSAGTKRQRVKDAIDTWENAPGQLGFDRGDDIQGSSEGCPGDDRSFVGWPIIDGAGHMVGATRVCHFTDEPNRAKSFYVLFDRSEDWYDDVSTPPPPAKLDLQSIATHEFGHATGWGFGSGRPHFGQNLDGTTRQPEFDNLCVDEPRHTMCPALLLGYAYWRTLEDHDKHTFANRY
jgi:hypothetical protein